MGSRNCTVIGGWPVREVRNGLISLAAVFVLLILAAAVTGVGIGIADAQPVCNTVEYTETDDGTLEIETLEQLQCIGDKNSSGTLTDDYVLVEDIDASPTAEWTDGFEPLGLDGDGHRFIGESAGDAFTGTFDGNGHTITGLVIDQGRESSVPRDEATTTGMIAINEGTITNLTLAETSVSGNFFVGGLVGFNEFEGEITNIHVSGTVTGDERVGVAVGRDLGYLENVTTAGEAHGDIAVGGLIGATGGLIVESHSEATAHGKQWVGGFAGGSNGQIVNASAHGDVYGDEIVGGFLGYKSNASVGPRPYELVRVKATGTVTGEREVGGLVGRLRGETQVVDSYATATVVGEDTVGGLIGMNRGTVESGYAAGAVTGTTNTDGIAGKNSGFISDVYADVSATRTNSTVGTSLGSVTEEAPANEMTGETVLETMSLDFSGAWGVGGEDSYPKLASESTPLYRCGVVSHPGTYELVVTPFSADNGTCLTITADDVTLVGNGLTVPNTTLEHDPKDAVPAVRVGAERHTPQGENSLENVTVTSLNVSEWFCGVALEGVTGGNVSEIHSVGETAGVCLAGSADITVTDLSLDGGTTLSFVGQNVTVGSGDASVTELDGLGFSASATAVDGQLRNLRVRGNTTTELDALWEVSAEPTFVSSGGVSGDEFQLTDVLDELPTSPDTGQFIVGADRERTNVTITAYSDKVAPGDPITLTYRIENNGSVVTNTTVTVSINETVAEQTTVGLGTGDTTERTVSLTAPTSDGVTEMTVATDSSTARTQLAVESEGDPGDGDPGDGDPGDGDPGDGDPGDGDPGDGDPGDGDPGDGNGNDDSATERNDTETEQDGDSDGFGGGFGVAVAFVALGTLFVLARRWPRTE